MAMEESKELQTAYKIFRSLIYVSVVLEFFMFALDPQILDFWNGIVGDIHGRMKQWFIYNDGNLIYCKIATFLLVCITCIGTRNKKHLEFDARRQVLYPFVFGVGLLILAVVFFNFGHKGSEGFLSTRIYTIRLNIIFYMMMSIVGTILVHVALDGKSSPSCPLSSNSN